MSEKWDQLSINKNVDTAKTITHVGLCAGYGGIELGLKRVLPTLRSVALCEIEAFAIANLVAKMEAGLMDAAPVWTDLKTFPWESFRDRVDILTGGYPCQPFSAAGKRAGKDDPRHLWPWIADGIAAMRPRVCFFENVEGHISLGLPDVIEDLGRLGYRATWGIFSASVDAGAPHQRKRVFILAHCKSAGLEGYDGLLTGCGESRRDTSEQKGQAGWGNNSRDAWPSRPGKPQHAWEPPRVVANAEGCMSGIKAEWQGRESAGGGGQEVVGDSNSDRRECNVPRDAPQQNSNGQDNGVSGEADSMGNAQSIRSATRRAKHEGLSGELRVACASGKGVVGNADGPGSQERSRQRGTGVQRADADGRTDAKRQVESTLGGDADGTSSGLDDAKLCVTCDNRTDELRLLGNGVVPATAVLAFSTLFNELASGSA